MERGSLQLSFGIFGKSFIAEVLRSREISIYRIFLYCIINRAYINEILAKTHITLVIFSIKYSFLFFWINEFCLKHL